jgi:hypothetical protein
VQQVVERFPQLMGSITLENMEAKVEFLLKTVGVSKPRLGQVRYFSAILVCN